MQRHFTALAAALLLAAAAYGQDCFSDSLSIDTTAGPHPFTSLNLNNDDCKFQFAIVTDRTGGHRPGVFMDGVRKLNLLQPEFVMSVGDLIEGYTEDTVELERQWEEFTGFTEQLEMPFFYVPGNHDITNELMEEVYLERFGQTYYHFVYKDVLFLCLNSEDQYRGSNRGTISDEQYEYIKQTLSENEEVRWTLVFMHQPLWILEDTKRWVDVEKLLATRKHTVFVGHHHHYVKYERNNGRYFMLATTGGGSPLRGPQLGEFDHVVWVTMTEQGPVLANLLLDGIWSEDVVTKASMDFFEALIERRPIRIEPLFTEGDSFAEGQVMVKVFNDENVPMSVEWGQSFSWDLSGKLSEPATTVPPNSVDTLLVQLKARDGRVAVSPEMAGLPLKAEVRLDSSAYPGLSVPFSFNLQPAARYRLEKARQPVSVDGDLAEWAEMPYQLMDEPEAGLSARFGLQYDEEWLYIAAEVRDDELLLDTAEVAWRQDYVGFVLNGEPMAVSAMRKGKGWYENSILFTVAPATDRLPASVYYEDRLPEGTQYHCAATGDQSYRLEAAIPLAYIRERQGDNWRSMRFNLIVQDRDSGKEDWPRYTFMPDWRGDKNFVGSGMFFRD